MERRITSPDDPALGRLCERLAASADELDADGAWPREQLQWCAAAGVHEWFIPRERGGQGWSEPDLLRGYLRLAEACLTTTFVLTQRSGGCQRIAASSNRPLGNRLLPGLMTGETETTIGLSHLTTSRQHTAPALLARETGDGFILNGFSPWVTGADAADFLVLGATVDEERQLLAIVPVSQKGVTVQTPASLLALSASHTGRVDLADVLVPRDDVLAGPVAKVLGVLGGGKTGGLQTSCLAFGLARAATAQLRAYAADRPALVQPCDAFSREIDELVSRMLDLAAGQTLEGGETLRARANSLALRSTQATLAAAKGAGFVKGHPAGRWSREALFFLVWSCPPPVMAANLCEFAGLGA